MFCQRHRFLRSQCFPRELVGALVLPAVPERRDELLEAMARLRGRGYTCVLFAIVDILREKTTLLVEGHTRQVAEAIGGEQVGEHVVELPGIVSRKKHLVPRLGAISASRPAASSMLACEYQDRRSLPSV